MVRTKRKRAEARVGLWRLARARAAQAAGPVTYVKHVLVQVLFFVVGLKRKQSRG